MTLARLKGIYSIFVGISIALLWLILFSSGQIPELETEPFNITFHIISELILAVSLVLSGMGLLLNRERSENFNLFSMGLLIYSLINAAGYYGQQGDWIIFLMFSVLFLTASVFIILSMKN